MTTIDNAAVARAFFEQLIAQGNWGSASEILSPDMKMHHPSSPTPIVGADNVGQFLQRFRSAFSNFSMTVEFAFAGDDKAAVRWRMRGTHTADLFGIPPTAKDVTVVGISLFRLVGGKIVEDWVAEDSLGLMRQLGVIPAAG